MIASWMLHAVLVSLLLGLAARAAEGALRAYRLPVRWAWLGAAAGALALPAAAATDLGRRVGDLVGSSAAVGGGTLGLAPGGTAGAAPPPAGVEGLALPALPAAVEPVALVAWAAGSLVLGALSLRSWWRLRRRRGDWERATVEGEAVLVSEETGPASIGFLDPVLVLPGWVLELPAEERRMVVRHEVEHREAGDSALLTLGVAALVAAPWNPALWWIVRRLRLAVELDCDRRVLADGTAPGDYGALLLEITRGRRVQPIPAAALGPRRSQLERRIRAMTDSIPRFRTARTALLTLAAAGLLAAACDAPTPSEEPPTGPEATTSRAVDGTSAAEGPVDPSDGPAFVPRDVDPRATNDGEITRLLKVHAARLKHRQPGTEVRGTATVWIYVDAEGRVSDVKMQESSGREALDRAAMSVASRMEFEPATRDGEPVGVWVSREITFRPSELDPGDLRTDGGDRAGLRLEADSLRLRGNAPLRLGAEGSPLVVVDGEPVDSDGALADLRPSEIASIEVLKGPAAVEAYGEEARDGVVRITTKAAASGG